MSLAWVEDVHFKIDLLKHDSFFMCGVMLTKKAKLRTLDESFESTKSSNQIHEKEQQAAGKKV